MMKSAIEVNVTVMEMQADLWIKYQPITQM